MQKSYYLRFKHIDTEISAIEFDIKQNNHKIRTIGFTFAPRDISGIDYEREPVQTSRKIPTVFEVASRINSLEEKNEELFHRLEQLKAERSSILHKADSTKHKVYLWWLTGRPNHIIAKKVGKCVRQIERYTVNFNKNIEKT